MAVTLLATPTLASAPATGTWAALGQAAPALFAPGNLNWVRGSRFGPDGRLYVYGSFSDAGGDPTADNLVAYDPATDSWHGLGSNGVGDGALNHDVMDIAWLNGALIAAGSFTDAGGVKSADYIAAWNGSSWSRRGAINNGAPNGWVNSLAVRNGVLYAGGVFSNADGVATADGIAAWDGYHWTGLGSNGAGVGPLNGGKVFKLRAIPDGRVFIGGSFTAAGGDPAANNAAWWDGTAWHSIGSSPQGGLGGEVWDILVVGSRIYVAGRFLDAGGNPNADYVAEWTGSGWTNLGLPIQNSVGPVVASLAAYGSNIIAGGVFSSAGGVAGTDHVAVWNGSKWMPLGPPIGCGCEKFETEIFGLDVVGRTLYVAGDKSSMGGVTGADGIAAFGLPAPPSAPRALTGTPGPRRVRVAWTAPVTANGALIRDYVVQFRRLGTTAWTTFADGLGTSRAATVTGLRTGVTYQFRVRAVSDWGTGPASTVIARRPR